MLTTVRLNIPGRIFAERLLQELSECCDHNFNLISVNDYYALRLFIRELSVDRFPNGDGHYLIYFVDSRELDGNEEKLKAGNRMLQEQLIEYRSKKRNKTFKTLDSFIHSLNAY